MAENLDHNGTNIQQEQDNINNGLPLPLPTDDNEQEPRPRQPNKAERADDSSSKANTKL